MKSILKISTIGFVLGITAADVNSIHNGVDTCVEHLTAYNTAKSVETKARRDYNTARAGFDAARKSIASWIRDEMQDSGAFHLRATESKASGWKKLLTREISGKCSGNSNGHGILCGGDTPYTKGTSVKLPVCNAGENSEHIKGTCASSGAADVGCDGTAEDNKALCESRTPVKGTCDDAGNNGGACAQGVDNEALCVQLSSDNSANAIKQCIFTASGDTCQFTAGTGCTQSFEKSVCCQAKHKKTFHVYEQNFLDLEDTLNAAEIAAANRQKELWACSAAEATLDAELQDSSDENTHTHTHTHSHSHSYAVNTDNTSTD